MCIQCVSLVTACPSKRVHLKPRHIKNGVGDGGGSGGNLVDVKTTRKEILAL